MNRSTSDTSKSLSHFPLKISLLTVSFEVLGTRGGLGMNSLVNMSDFRLEHTY